MKRLLLIQFILLLPLLLNCQKQFVRGTVEVFDKYEMNLKRIGGNGETFRMTLIRKINQTAKDTMIGVNVEIESVKKSELFSTTGLTIASNLDFALGSSTVTKIDRQKGEIFLSFTEFISLIDFFNETISIKAKEPDYDTGWQLQIENRFALAILYDSKPGISGQKWKYYLRLNEAEFELPYDDALELFKKLSSFKKQINEGFK